ncbi:hypothetical protein EVAR_26894_1 [Eumeta japonica]|uniref:Uncharacterized protein n=1 Tax=Eumeta variegata TaxID=151549 RepID=A0A4C1VTW0_EUMVA|nr:hypothetical protein EVAR_26894_1 [Eumeta japonica]
MTRLSLLLFVDGVAPVSRRAVRRRRTAPPGNWRRFSRRASGRADAVTNERDARFMIFSGILNTRRTELIGAHDENLNEQNTAESRSVSRAAGPPGPRDAITVSSGVEWSRESQSARAPPGADRIPARGERSRTTTRSTQVYKTKPAGGLVKGSCPGVLFRYYTNEALTLYDIEEGHLKSKRLRSTDRMSRKYVIDRRLAPAVRPGLAGRRPGPAEAAFCINAFPTALEEF